MKKVFLTEPIHEDGVNILKTVADVTLGTSTDKNTIIKEAAGCDAILIRSAVISEEIIKNIPTLKVIAKHGIGVDNIDVKAATEHGDMVVNAPKANINSVAEHALSMILALSKNFVIMDSKTRSGEFSVRNKILSMEIKGKTVGLIGLGKIAMLLVKKLKSLDVNIIGYDPFISALTAEEAGVKLVSDINELYAQSDFVSVHVPLIDKTRGMIGKEEFKRMKKSAYFINVARGPIVKENELYEALKNGDIKGAATDVFEEEPPLQDNPLFSLDNILISPHNAALTGEALVAMTTHSAQGIVDYLSGRKPEYIVNLEVLNKIN